MGISIPPGHVFIGGRSGERASALLAAADNAGLSRKGVRATEGGYIVEEAVAAEYERAAGFAPAEAEAEAVPDGSWKNADIESYAEEHGINLGDASKKADMLAAIAAAGEKE